MSNAYAIFDIASEYATSSIVGAQLVSALLPEAAPKISLDNKVQAWHNTACKHGGVGAPVGLTVFKTAGGSLGAVPGGFDSHTPLPVIFQMSVRFPSLPRKRSSFHRSLGKSQTGRPIPWTFSDDSSVALPE